MRSFNGRYWPVSTFARWPAASSFVVNTFVVSRPFTVHRACHRCPLPQRSFGCRFPPERGLSTGPVVTHQDSREACLVWMNAWEPAAFVRVAGGDVGVEREPPHALQQQGRVDAELVG